MGEEIIITGAQNIHNKQDKIIKVLQEIINEVDAYKMFYVAVNPNNDYLDGIDYVETIIKNRMIGIEHHGI